MNNYDLLPIAVIELDAKNAILTVNGAAETMFDLSRVILLKKRLDDVLLPHARLLSLIAQARQRRAGMTEYDVEFTLPNRHSEKIVDVMVSTINDRPDHFMLVLQERSVAGRMTRALSHRGAARSVSAMASLLAHEIKNPLSGIRGAAQLLESSITAQDKPLASLIREEVDRIVRLVDRYQGFSDVSPHSFSRFNMHELLDHVAILGSNGFARHIKITKIYDPSLPEISGHRDRIVQVLLNLLKNAAEAIGEEHFTPEITLTTAYKHGVGITNPSTGAMISLPFEICIIDNGPGISPEMMPLLFEPFVTNKSSGSGLGLASVAKIISDHGGVVECERLREQTIFRILLPIEKASKAEIKP